MRSIGLVLALVLALGPPAGEAQNAVKTHRVGLLSPPPGAYVAAFEESLRQLGYVRGENVAFETRRGGMKGERLREAVADLLRLDVEVIVTGPNPFIDAAKEATKTVPIVMVYGGDPVGRGYIASLARPGSNITGLTWESSLEIFGKHVELLSELSPRPSRIAVIVESSTPQTEGLKEAEVAAKRLGITLQYVRVDAEGDVPKAFNAIVAGRAGAVMVFGGPGLWTLREAIARLATKNGLPTTYMYREGPSAGGLMSYGTNLTDSWRQAARYVDKILKGAKPADIPVQQPTTFELVVNMRTAKVLGLTIPPSLLVRADEIIQ
jgi:ABC-type uncharacterized transport system substrate-binding protein